MNLKAAIAKRNKAAISAARKSGKYLMDNFGKTLNIKSKGDRSLATNIDLKAEEIIVTIIKKSFPQDNILAEENKYEQFASDFKWVIDPLDGTHNYIRGQEAFGVSIGLEYRGKLALGVIYMPVSNEFYTAQKGKGAYLNGKKISVSKNKLSDATIVYDSSLILNQKRKLNNLGKLASRVFNIRMFGCSVRSLTYLACGKADLVVEYDEKPWDCAAGIIIAQEAGAKVTNHKGQKWNPGMPDHAASNGIIHKEVINILKRG